MKNLTVKKMLVLAFGALAGLVLLVSVLGLRALGQSNDRFTSYVNEAAKRAALTAEVRGMVNARAIGARNLVLVPAAERDAENDKTVKAHEAVLVSLQKLKEAAGTDPDATDKDRAMVGEIARVEAAYGPVALDIVKLAMADKRDEAIEKMNKECRPLLAALLKAGGDYLAYSQAEAQKSATDAASSASSQRALLITISLVALGVALALGWLIARSLSRSLGAEPAVLSEAVSRVAEGDLSPIEGADDAPAGSVLASVGAMQRQLEGLISQVRSAAESIATASAQIAQGNQDLSGRTEEQASALEQTAASMEELGSTVRQNADNAKQADQLAQGASRVAADGGQVVSDVVTTMGEINASSKKISDIIGVIDGIAFQTNILALNAAVEAARAGEQGRGFAVVAGEVRTLAGRSAEAAREIKSLIAASVERVEQGTALVDKAGSTMEQIVNSIRRVTDIMGEISSASSEQSAGVGQVSEAVSQMDRATQQNAALVEESAAASESLRNQAQQLVQAVSVFRTSRAR